MKKSTLFLFLIMALTFVVIASCGDDDLEITCGDYVLSLNALQHDIETLASSSVCDDEFECRSIAFGVKACGGPRTYLVYSTSIDTLLLANMVGVYNDIEDEYNQVCDVVSDCSAPQEPTGFECEDNVCVPIF